MKHNYGYLRLYFYWLPGDNKQTAKAIAEQVGITRYILQGEASLMTMNILRNNLNRGRSRVPHLNIFLHICLCFMSIIICKHSGKSYGLKLWRNLLVWGIMEDAGKDPGYPSLFFSIVFCLHLHSLKNVTKQAGWHWDRFVKKRTACTHTSRTPKNYEIRGIFILSCLKL